MKRLPVDILRKRNMPMPGLRTFIRMMIGICVLGTFSTLIAAPDQAVLDAEARRIAVIEKAKPAVLSIFELQGRGGGSGVVISADGYAITNFHVVQPCGAAMKCGMADGRAYDAVLVGLDPTGDVALIKLLGRDDFPFAETADSDQVRPGDGVLAMGNPFLLSTNLQPTVTYGIISGVHRYQFPSATLLEYTDCLQTDASINPGNSGGPLFDDKGRLIGINGRCSFDKRGRVSVGVGYAVSINQIKNFLGHLKSGRIVDHATLGARVTTDEEGRLVVAEILEQSDAFRRGLRDNDEIVSFAGRTVSTANGFKNILGILPKGWRVPLSYRRDGKRYDILVRLPPLHHQEELLQATESHRSEEPMPLPPPDEQPNPKTPKPGEKPDGPKKPDPGGRRPAAAQTPAAEMPDIVKKSFQEKRGYANYYFNKLSQDRIWKAWNGKCRLADRRGPWSLSGSLPNGGTFNIEISDGRAELKAPSLQSQWTPGDDSGSSLNPPHSGGLLAALYLWRRLAVEGVARFGDVYYLGTAPLAGREGLADVIVGTYKSLECRFYFDPAEGNLLALEMFPDEDADPCEVYFSQYHDIDGGILPGRMEVRFGDEVFGTLTINEFRFEKTVNK
ncbi:MAG: trypsin-like peptidase domain-containing protein [Thermoguttaceae bacterium]|jgi:S1-C subfamily serine protease